MPSQFTFVSYKDEGKHNSIDRLHIRSHCMKGKNKREGSRRSLQEARRRAKATQASQAAGTHHESETALSRQEPALDSQTSFWTRPLKNERIKALSQMSLSPPVDPAISRFAHKVSKTPYELLNLGKYEDYFIFQLLI